MNSTESQDKRVWVIGAGASVGHTDGLFPTLANLPAKAEEMGAIAGWLGTDGLEQLQGFCKQHYGKSFTGTHDLDWEELFTTLDISMTLAPSRDTASARDTLEGIIRNTIRALHEQWNESGVRRVRTSVYDLLKTELRANDTIISFNWDLLLDDVLGRPWKLGNLAGPTIQYSNFVDQFTGFRSDDSMAPPALAPIQGWNAGHSYYLKLHGSLDWFACDNPSCQLNATIFPLSNYGVAPLCGACVEPMTPLIVPPTLDKKLHANAWSRRIWACAAKELAHATTLVILGYSLPHTDFFSNWLFRQTDSSRLKLLAVINPALVDHSTAQEPATEELRILARDWVEFGSDYFQHMARALPSASEFLTYALFETAEDFFMQRRIEQKYPILAKDIGYRLPRQPSGTVDQ